MTNDGSNPVLIYLELIQWRIVKSAIQVNDLGYVIRFHMPQCQFFTLFIIESLTMGILCFNVPLEIEIAGGK